MKSCNQLLQYGVTENGIYFVNKQFVYCDQGNDGGGWIVIQRRKDALENFNRTYLEYQSGFGNYMESFWFGNSRIASFTNSKTNLLVNLVLTNGSKYYAFYETFNVDSLANGYRLYVSGYKGE